MMRRNVQRALVVEGVREFGSFSEVPLSDDVKQKAMQADRTYWKKLASQKAGMGDAFGAGEAIHYGALAMHRRSKELYGGRLNEGHLRAMKEEFVMGDDLKGVAPDKKVLQRVAKYQKRAAEYPAGTHFNAKMSENGERMDSLRPEEILRARKKASTVGGS